MKSPQHRVRPTLEPLEDRHLPAAGASLVGGVLQVVGTSYADKLTVTESGGNVSVSGMNIKAAGKLVGQVPASAISQVKVWGYGGDDTINLAWSVNRPHTVWAGTNNDTVWGSPGNDVIWGDSGNDLLMGQGGHDEIHGGNHADKLWGQDGHDKLYGGAGDDYLDGGAGIDLFQGNQDFNSYRDDFELAYPVRDGFSRFDVVQGFAGTCSIDAAMAEAAERVNLYGSIGRQDNWYQVRLWDNGQPSDQWVSFNGTWDDRDCKPGQFRAADGTLTGQNNGEFWTVLYQRAYLQMCGVNTTNPNSDYWTWSRYNFRDSARALHAVTGWTTSVRSIGSKEPTSTAAALAGNLQRGDALIAGGTGHAYAIVDVYRDASNNWYVKLCNPWGKDATHRSMSFGRGQLANDGEIVLSWSVFRANFRSVDISRR